MKENQNNILSIWAHADDSAWAAGGTIATWSRDASIDNVLLSDSDGQGVGHLRIEEERSAMKILGMRDLYPVGNVLRLADGQLSSYLSIMVPTLLHVIDSATENGNPYQSILSFGTDGYTGHPDHVAVAQAVCVVYTLRENIRTLIQVGMTPQERNAMGDYFVPIPNIIPDEYQAIDISQTLPVKTKALEQHRTQLQNGVGDHLKRLPHLPQIELIKSFSR